MAEFDELSTPDFFQAIESNNISKIDVALNNDIGLLTHKYNGNTPIMTATAKDNIALVHHLQQQFNDQTPLIDLLLVAINYSSDYSFNWSRCDITISRLYTNLYPIQQLSKLCNDGVTDQVAETTRWWCCHE